MRYTTPLILLAIIAISGCQQVAPDGDLTKNIGQCPPASCQRSTDQADLTAAVSAESVDLVTGDSLAVTVTVTNHTDSAIEINSLSSAKIRLLIRRRTMAGWEVLLRYPQTEAMVVTPWSVAAGETTVFNIPLTVEPTWPTHERLRLIAAVNGTDVTSPPVTIMVTQPAD